MRWAAAVLGLLMMGCAPALKTPDVGVPTQSKLMFDSSRKQIYVMMLGFDQEGAEAYQPLANQLLVSSLNSSGYFTALTKDDLKSALKNPDMIGKIPNAKFIASGSVDAVGVNFEVVSKLRHRTKMTYTATVTLKLISIETGQQQHETTQTATLVAITKSAEPDDKLQTAVLRDAIDQAVRTLAARM